MATLKVSQAGYDARTAGVQNLLIDSDYASMLEYSAGNGTKSIPSSGSVNVQFPIPGTWLPLGFFFTDWDDNGHSTPNKFYFQKNNGGVGFVAQGWTPMFNTGTLQYSGWEYIWVGGGSVVTATYYYYITYLQADGLYNNTQTLTATPPYFNLSIPGANANSNQVTDLAFTTLTPMVGIAKEVVITLTGTGNGGVLEMSFAHGLGRFLPFTGVITTSSIWGSNVINFSTANLLLSSNFETFDFAADATNFYLDINNSQNAVNYSTTIHVYFIQLHF